LKNSYVQKTIWQVRLKTVSRLQCLLQNNLNMPDASSAYLMNTMNIGWHC